MRKVTVIVFILFFGIQAFAEMPPAYQKTFFWEFQGKRFNMKYSFDADEYRFYKQTRRNYYDFSVYLKEAPGYLVIDAFAAKLKGIATTSRLTPLETVEFVASFVQNLSYRDDGKYEYPRYPIETLVEQGGDCEDTAILLAAILRSMGFQSILLSPTGHMGVGLAVTGEMDGMGVDYKGAKYYYLETTNTGWGLGDYPENLSNNIKVYDPGYLAGTKPLGAQKETTYAERQIAEPSTHKDKAEETDYSFQTDYISNSQLLSDGEQVYSEDTMVIDGKAERVVTYDDNGKVRYVDDK